MLDSKKKQIIPLLGAIGLLVAVVAVLASKIINAQPHSALGQVITAQNISSLQIAKVLKRDAAITSLAIGQDGTLVFATSGADPVVGIWNYGSDEAPQTLPVFPNEGVSYVAVDPNNKYIAATSSYLGPAALINVKLWKKEYELKSDPNGRDRFGQVVFSLDGSELIATNSALDKDGNYSDVIQLWDTQSGKLQNELRGDGSSIAAIALSPDGISLLTGSTVPIALNGPQPVTPAPLHLWNIKTGQIVATLNGHTEDATSIAFNPKDGTAASGSYDSSVIIWDLKTYRAISTIKMPNAVYKIAFSPDGKLLTAGGNFNGIYVWDGQSARSITSFLPPLPNVDPRFLEPTTYSAAVFSPDGRALFLGDQYGNIDMLTVP